MIQTKLIDAGWRSLAATLPDEMPPEIVESMRATFFAGALHAFASITEHRANELTEADVHRRMTGILNELISFEKEVRASRTVQ